MKSNWFNRFKTKLKSSIDNINDLPPIKLGIIYAILIISITKLVYLIINYTYLILIFYNLLRLFISIFCIFSLFTWLNLILSGSQYFTDTRIFVLLLTCFTSEFLIQFTVFNTNLFTNVKSFNDLIKYLNSTYYSQFSFETYDDNNYNNMIYKDELELINNNNNNYQSTITSLNYLFYYLVENFHNAILIGLTCTLTNCLYTKRLNINENLFIVLVVFLTRFYGTVNFSSLIPKTICAYFTYFCAFSGVLFSKYLENFLNIFNFKNDNKINDSNGQHENKIKLNQDNKIDLIIKNLAKNDNKLKSGSNIDSKVTSRSSKWNKFLNFNNNFINFKRRTSLPTISAKCEKEQIELNALIVLKKDIQSIIDDVFNNTDQLNVLNLVKGYKSIQSRLNQVNLLTYLTNKSFKNGIVNGKINHKSKNESWNEKFDLSDNCDDFNSYSADEDEENKLNLLDDNFLQSESKQTSSQKKNKNRANSNNTINVPVQFLTSSYNKHRNSQILTWSTTTSANGYPNIELLQSSKQRSLSLRGSNLQINNNSLINFNSVDNKLNQKYSNNINTCNINKNTENDLNFKEFSINFNKLFNQLDSKSSSKKNDRMIDSRVNLTNENDSAKNSYEEKNVQKDSVNTSCNSNNKINISKAAKTSDYDSCESPNSSDYNSDTDKLLLKVNDLKTKFSF
jgi:hypothetical protein